MKAVVPVAPRKASLVNDRPLPTPRDHDILVKTVSVALNPTDWKSIDFAAHPGTLSGCDYSGVVEEVGKAVTKPFKKGDRVCGFAHGGNAARPEEGAFAEHIVVKGDLQIPIPDNLSFQEAATLGVGITTVGQSLYQSLKLDLPTSPTKVPAPVLIYGGSTATGTLAIQFAKLSGYTVLTTCSPHNFDLMKTDAVFDYNDPSSAAEIRKYTKDGLKLVLDNIALEPSAKYCEQAISTQGGVYTALGKVAVDRANVDSRWTLGYTVFGEEFSYGQTVIPAKPEDLEFGKKFWALAETLLAEGKVVVHPPKVNPGGLKGVLEGLQLMREDKVSGVKLVYNVDETP